MAGVDLLVGRSGNSLPRNFSLQTFQSYRENEHSQRGGCQAKAALCLDFETLALRVDPPNVKVESRTVDDGRESTFVTVDSANFPGILVEMCQIFTELGVEVRSARISSESSFFCDVFEVLEPGGGPVRCQRKLANISRMLNVNYGLEDDLVANGDDTDDVRRVETSVFELSGQDGPGLLADVTQLLTTNGCNVRSAAVWTYASRVAFVLSVTAKGSPIQDGIKLQRLQQLLLQMMSAGDGRGTVEIKKVRGEVHHDRRLHQLMLREASAHFDVSEGVKRSLGESPPTLSNATSHTTSLSDSAGSVHSDLAAAAYYSAVASPLDTFRSPKHSRPDVNVTYCGRSGYWLVDIKCKDRAKLLFDTVCTLADCGFEVFHATIDGNHGVAEQEFYVRPRGGVQCYDERAAQKLQAMLVASVQRRFPKGLKVHVHSVDRFGCLAALTRVLKVASLTVTRAKVKTYAANNSSGHTFYVMNADGTAPDRERVEESCSAVGGRLVEAGEEATSCSPIERGGVLEPGHKFSFSILNRQWGSGWGGGGGSAGSPDSDCGGGSGSGSLGDS